jgi:aspartate/tyrosine/aromatic aminotransferase
MGLHAKKVPSIFFLQQVMKFIFQKNIYQIKTARFKQVQTQGKGGRRICPLL